MIQMTLKINDTAPDFEAETTQGKINLYDFGDREKFFEKYILSLYKKLGNSFRVSR